ACRHSLLHSFPTRRSSDLITFQPNPFLIPPQDILNKLAKEPERLKMQGVFITESTLIMTFQDQVYWLTLDNVENGRVLLNYLVRSEEHTSELQSRFDLVCR